MEEPTARELTARIDYLEKLLRQENSAIRELMATQFKGQETAVQAALAAQEKFNFANSAASKEAITKAEDGQRTYNATHNDLNRKMEAQYAMMIPRTEAMAQYQHILEKHDDLKKEIAGLRESRREGAGEKSGSLSNQRIIMMILSAIGSLLLIGGIVVSIAFAIRK